MKLKLGKPGTVEIDRDRVSANFDAKAISRLVRNHQASMKSRMDEELRLAQSKVDLLDLVADPGVQTIDRRKAEALAKRLAKEAKLLASEEPPRVEKLTGHNPVLFPPYFPGMFQSFAGGAVASPIFHRRPEIGMLALSVAAYPPFGAIDRRLWMGALTMAPSEEMAIASVSTFVGGTVMALTILGYAHATANLLINISAEGSGGFRMASGINTIDDRYEGVNRIPLTNLTAVARLMVRADDLVLVSCGVQVIAGCGGIVCSAASNMAMSGTTMVLL